MKHIHLFLISFSFASILHVDGNEFTSIQSAIDAALDNDTVLVYNGIYYENLDIHQTITVASLALYDDLDSWFEYDPVTHQYEINNENILNTIIDGSQPVDENFQSAVLLRSTSNDCIAPTIMGFTIQNGMGTFVTEEVEDPLTEGETVEADRMIGGGIYSYLTHADIHHNFFSNNGSPELQSGGAGYAQSSAEDWSFDNRSEGTPRCEVESISMHDNFYRDNDAVYGNTFSNRTFTGEIDMSSSLFDIYYCPESNVTSVWVDINPEAEIGFDGSAGDLCAMTDDVWVAADGNDNTGDATQNNPVRTIAYALEIIAPTETNQIVIHLEEGTFSPITNGETFPIMMISNTHLRGAGEEMTILDARMTGRVLNIEGVENVAVSDLTIQNGLAGTPGLPDPTVEFPFSSGGGISVWFSSPILTNLTITGNMATGEGGGICLFSDSNPQITNVTLHDNESTHYGGGIFMIYSNPTLTNVVISENIAKSGGGIMLSEGTPTFNNVFVDGNIANGNNSTYQPVGNGGGIFMVGSDPIMVNMTVSNNYASFFGGGIGLYADDEIAPNSPMMKNVKITGNTSVDIGAGLWVMSSTPTLTNVEITGNTTETYGAGICFAGSSSTLTNVTIADNVAGGGAGMVLDAADIEIVNSIIWGNIPNSYSYVQASSIPDFSYSNVQLTSGDVQTGVGNIYADPLFSDSENGDYSLQLESPCVDAGTADLDGDGVDDLNIYFGSAPDMGAYEFDPTMSGDLNGDLAVNVQDVIILVSFVLVDEEFSELELYVADLNQDDMLNIVDILLMVNIILDS